VNFAFLSDKLSKLLYGTLPNNNKEKCLTPTRKPITAFGMILYLNFEKIMEYFAQKSDKNLIRLGLVYIFRIKYIIYTAYDGLLD